MVSFRRPRRSPWYRIGAGHVEHQAGAVRLDHARQVLRQERQILVVVRAVGQRDVEVARFLAAGKLLAPCIESVKTAGSSAESRGGAVALMDVEVRRPGSARVAPARVSTRDRHGDVVEHAVALAAIGERVVGAAGEIARDAVFERRARRRNVPQRRRGARDQSRDHGKPMRR